MDIHPPFIITARLLPGLHIGNSFISIETGQRNHEGRTCFVVYIDAPGMEYRDDTLKSGRFGGTHLEAMRDFIAFLSACAEASEDGDNYDLFPPHVREWARHNITDIEVAGCDLETP